MIDTLLFCAVFVSGECQDTNRLILQHHPARAHFNGQWLRITNKPTDRDPVWRFVTFHRDADGDAIAERGVIYITDQNVTLLFDERGIVSGKRLK